LEATPGEGTTYRFARMDKKRFGRVLVANDEAFQKGAKPYYTNSSQLPVNFTEDVFEALDLQDELQCKYTGGTVFHTFVGEKMTKDSVKNMIKKISNNYHLPYFTLTPTFSVCPIHGYLNGEHEYCPKCDADIEEADAIGRMKTSDAVGAGMQTTAFSVSDDVTMEVSDEEVALAEGVKPVAAEVVVSPSIVVENDTITVVEPSSSKLNFGGDTNGED